MKVLAAVAEYLFLKTCLKNRVQHGKMTVETALTFYDRSQQFPVARCRFCRCRFCRYFWLDLPPGFVFYEYSRGPSPLSLRGQRVLPTWETLQMVRVHWPLQTGAESGQGVRRKRRAVLTALTGLGKHLLMTTHLKRQPGKVDPVVAFGVESSLQSERLCSAGAAYVVARSHDFSRQLLSSAA